mgnify:CR=1 FL=1
MLTEQEIRNVLSEIEDPELHRPITDLNMVRRVRVDGSRVEVEIALTVSGCPLQHVIEGQVREKLRALPEVKEVQVILGVMDEQERKKLLEQIRGTDLTPRTRIAEPDSGTRIIAVGSGKGGVGKSTVTVNLALALAQQGLRVGIIDLDIYGFSVPRLLGIKQRPMTIDDAVVPVESHGMQVMSMAFFVQGNQPVIWRGPMITGAMEQFLRDVLWADLDYLVADLPPGTGDIPLTMAQRLSHAHLVVVTTPNTGATEVAIRTAYLAKHANMHIIGIVENMSYLECPDCHHRLEPFGSGGGESLAAELDVPLLGKIPLEGQVREGNDRGNPIMISHPGSTAATVFRQIAQQVEERISVRSPSR